MKIIIACVGKMRESPELALVQHYLKSSRWEVALKEVEEKRDLPVPARKKSEAEMLLAAVGKTEVIVALDEHGAQFDSPEFARNMQNWEEIGSLAFIIGGADGLAEEVRAKSDIVMSLGKMTLPHFLARVVLAEQIYRARTIIDGHPYHKK